MRSLLGALAMALALPAAGDDAVKVHAAGSLKAALTEAGVAFAARPDGAKVDFVFAPSGLIKERLEKGEASDLFASANMAHPKALADAGRAGPVRTFARNTLCALASPKVRIAPATVLETILDPALKLGISTPKADPAGDYAWQLFANAGQLRPGAREKIEAKALQLTGGPSRPRCRRIATPTATWWNRARPTSTSPTAPTASSPARKCRPCRSWPSGPRSTWAPITASSCYEGREARRVPLRRLPRLGRRPGGAGTPRIRTAAVIKVDLRAVWRIRVGDEVPPVEDFDPNLPAIAPPPVEETESEPVDPGKNPMLIVPDLDNAAGQPLPPVEEPSAPSELSTRPDTETKPDSLMIPSAEAAAPLKNAEAERLQQAAEADRRLRQQRQIQSRADRTGFKGFCPVALRDRRDLIDAQAEYSVTFGLQTYEFSSAEAKAAFESDPSRYAPAAGGNDVVLLVNSGEEQAQKIK